METIKFCLLLVLILSLPIGLIVIHVMADIERKRKRCSHKEKDLLYTCHQDGYYHEKCRNCGLDIYSGIHNDL